MDKKSTPLGARVWFSAVLFGFVGQIAWVVENMYFATLAQDIFANSGRSDLSYVVTTLMVIFSAIFATATTIFAGGLCDRVGKRKPFVAYGYIVWGLTIMIFAFLPMKAEGNTIGLVAFLLVAFDCLMTVAGSTANDAAFNTWVADVTDPTNRGKVNSVLAVLPVFATIVIFIGLGSLYSSENASNWLFFVVLGAIPMISGIVAIFLMKDSKDIVKNSNPDYIKEIFYGFRKEAVVGNKMMYVCLATLCVLGIAQQTFFSYLINYVQNTLGVKDFFIPLAVIVFGSAVITGACGALYDRLGRKHFYFPLLLCVIVGTLLLYLVKFTGANLVILYIFATLMMGGILSLSGALTSTFQDYIPKGYEGRYQGVRMCFTVLIPMIIGPLVSMGIGLSAMGEGGADFAPPYEIFLAATIIACLTAVPLFFVRKDAGSLRKRLQSGE